MLMGICNIYPIVLILMIGMVMGIYIFYVWASALFVSTMMGNARRLRPWDEQLVQRPTLFYIMYQTFHLQIFRAWGGSWE